AEVSTREVRDASSKQSLLAARDDDHAVGAVALRHRALLGGADVGAGADAEVGSRSGIGAAALEDQHDPAVIVAFRATGVHGAGRGVRARACLGGKAIAEP